MRDSGQKVAKMQNSNRMQAVADGYVAAGTFCGLEWQVECGGEVLQAGGAGVAEIETGRAIPDAALYRLYSMPKRIVSVLALCLVDQGVLRLSGPVVEFAQEVARMKVLGTDGTLLPARRLITLEDLLTHHAGFSYEFIHGCHNCTLLSRGGYYC
jgi:CubicO group peptidase (beta-lactamase class C family)